MRSHGPILAALLAAAVPAHAGTCLRDTSWGPQVAPWDQKMSLEPVWRLGGRALVAIRFNPLRGDYAKVYGFFLYDGTCVTKAITVGAFAAANGGRAVDDLPPGAPLLYHEDYFAADRHRTLEVSQDPPDFETVKAQAVDLLR